MQSRFYDIARLLRKMEPLIPATNGFERLVMTISTLALILLVLLVIGAFPSWPYSRSWGYYPSGGFGVILIILIVLVATRGV
jgi:hypothetical protein